MSDVVLDWSAARWSPGTCVDCGKPSNLRDPADDKPRHKPCAELVAVAPAVAGDAAALGPERDGKRRDTRKLVPGGPPPFDVARFRDLLAAFPPLPVKLHADDDESDDPAVATPSEVLERCRPVRAGDPVPKGCATVQAALEAAGWTVQATYARALLEGKLVESIALRCGRGRVRAWAVWANGKATGGQVQGVPGTMGVTAWRVATGSAPAPRAPRRSTPAQAPLLDLEAVAAGTPAQGTLL